MSRTIALFLGLALTTRANAQRVILHGDYGNGFEKFLVAGVAFAALCFAVFRYYRGRL
jgi:hypothetical protein